MCKECGCGQENGVVTKVFVVPGMMCNNCKETVEGTTLGLPGVLSSHVDLGDKTATISFEEAKIDENTISTAIEKTGFEVSEVKPYVHSHGSFLGAIKKLFN